MEVLRAFANDLGWSDLRQHRHAIEDCETSIIWYESGESRGSRQDLFLQIKPCPPGQSRTFTAAVFAIRYSICTGWHPLTLDAEQRNPQREAERLEGWLHRRWFESPRSRKQFRVMHPECAGWSWTRLRQEQPPCVVMGPAVNCHCEDSQRHG